MANTYAQREAVQGVVTDAKHLTPGLVRSLGTWTSTAVVIGSMIGQSIFLVPSQVARDVGSVGLLLAAWLIGGAIVLLATLCYAELGAALPQAGGDYVYIGRGLGQRWGFLSGWTSALLQGPAMAATISAGLLRFAAFLRPSVSEPIFTLTILDPFRMQPYYFEFTVAQVWAAAAILAVTAINYVGVRTAGRAQVLMTALKLTAILVIAGLGVTVSHPFATQASGSIATPEHGCAGAILTALVPIMLAYNGFQTLSQIGGEVADPDRTFPRAAILGVVAVVVVYFLTNVVYIRVLGLPVVANSQHVASDVAMRLAGPAGARWLTIIMMLSAIGSLHANFLGRSRVPYAMARDGQFFGFAKRIHPKYRTPSGSLMFHGSIAAALVLTGTFEEIYSLGIFSIWIFAALTAVALIRLRKEEPALPRPYRAWGHPWTPWIVAASAFAISANLWLMRPVRSSIGFVVILLGIPLSHHWRKRAVPDGGPQLRPASVA